MEVRRGAARSKISISKGILTTAKAKVTAAIHSKTTLLVEDEEEDDVPMVSLLLSFSVPFSFLSMDWREIVRQSTS